MDEKYIQFKNTLRADVKLRISLEEYLNAKETEKKPHGIQEYRDIFRNEDGQHGKYWYGKKIWMVFVFLQKKDGLPAKMQKNV